MALIELAERVIQFDEHPERAWLERLSPSDARSSLLLDERAAHLFPEKFSEYNVVHTAGLVRPDVRELTRLREELNSWTRDDWLTMDGERFALSTAFLQEKWRATQEMHQSVPHMHDEIWPVDSFFASHLFIMHAWFKAICDYAPHFPDALGVSRFFLHDLVNRHDGDRFEGNVAMGIGMYDLRQARRDFALFPIMPHDKYHDPRPMMYGIPFEDRCQQVAKVLDSQSKLGLHMLPKLFAGEEELRQVMHDWGQIQTERGRFPERVCNYDRPDEVLIVPAKTYVDRDVEQMIVGRQAIEEIIGTNLNTLWSTVAIEYLRLARLGGRLGKPQPSDLPLSQVTIVT